MKHTMLFACACLSGLGSPAFAQTESTMDVGRFGKVAIYQPAGTPRSIALFVSGDGGWNLGVVDMARAIAAQDAIVVGIDIRHYLGELAKPQAGCVSLAVDFENLNHRVQKKLALRAYLPPVLVGYSSGATVVYATLAQAPPGTFAGAMSLGFCPDQDFHGAPLCRGAGLRYAPNPRGDYVFEPAPHLRDSWVALQGQQDQVCDAHVVDTFGAQVAHSQIVRLPAVGHGFSVQKNWLPQFRAAYSTLSTPAPAVVTAPGVEDLPLIEVPATGESSAGQAATRFVLLLSGDGGWAGLDQDVAAQFSGAGVPVVGLDSLRYFWNLRTPEQATRDIGRTIQHYLSTWHRTRVDLVGYSFGADVLPAIYNRLPQSVRANVDSVTLISPSSSATFEIHVADWLPGEADAGSSTLLEVQRMRPARLLCLYGKNDEDAFCPQLPPNESVAVEIGTGHHLSGDAEAIVNRITAFSATGR